MLVYNFRNSPKNSSFYPSCPVHMVSIHLGANIEYTNTCWHAIDKKQILQHISILWMDTYARQSTHLKNIHKRYSPMYSNTHAYTNTVSMVPTIVRHFSASVYLFDVRSVFIIIFRFLFLFCFVVIVTLWFFYQCYLLLVRRNDISIDIDSTILWCFNQVFW